MFARILLLLLITPVVELALLIRFSQWVGFWWTVVLIVATAIAGSVLLKREGVSVWRKLQQRLGRGELPGTEIVDGVILLVSAVMLLAPGVLTDIAGIIGLIPPTRILIRTYLMRRFRHSISKGTMHVGFGSFGSMTYGDERDDPPADANDGWRGTPSEAPRHRHDAGPDPAP